VTPRRLWISLLAVVAASPLFAIAELGGRADFGEALTMKVLLHKACVRVDQAWRKACDLHRAYIPPRMLAKCQAPLRTFKDRTAIDYAHFREQYAAELVPLQPKIDAIDDDVANAFDLQYADLRSGQLSGMSLDFRTGALDGQCAVLETDGSPRLMAKPH